MCRCLDGKTEFSTFQHIANKLMDFDDVFLFSRFSFFINIIYREIIIGVERKIFEKLLCTYHVYNIIIGNNQVKLPAT